MILFVKLIVSVVLLLMALLFGTTPLRMKSGRNARKFFSLANCVAAGIFIGAALIHVLSDSVTLLGHVWDYPISFLLASVGFFVVFGVDRIFGHREGSSGLSPYILACILGVHSFIAGASVGLEHKLGGCIILLVAIMAHKGSASFALGVRLVESGLSDRSVRTTIKLFSFTTPTGVLVGIALAKLMEGPTALICEGLFDGVAAGTFLYVGILEILSEEFELPENQLIKFACALAGLGTMAVLAIWT